MKNLHSQSTLLTVFLICFLPDYYLYRINTKNLNKIFEQFQINKPEFLNDDEYSMLTLINDPINFNYNKTASQLLKRTTTTTSTTTTTTTDRPITLIDSKEKNQCICRMNNDNKFESYEILDELLRKNSVKTIKIHTHYYRKHLMHIFNGIFDEFKIKSKSFPSKHDSPLQINQTLSQRIMTVSTSTMPTTIITKSQQPLSTAHYHSLSFNKPSNILKTINKAVQYGAPFMATAMLAKTLRLSTNSKLAHRSSWQHRKKLINQFPITTSHDTALLLLNEKDSFPIFVVPEDLDYSNPEYLFAIPANYPLR